MEGKKPTLPRTRNKNKNWNGLKGDLNYSNIQILFHRKRKQNERNTRKYLQTVLQVRVTPAPILRKIVTNRNTNLKFTRMTNTMAPEIITAENHRIQNPLRECIVVERGTETGDTHMRGSTRRGDSHNTVICIMGNIPVMTSMATGDFHAMNHHMKIEVGMKGDLKIGQGTGNLEIIASETLIEKLITEIMRTEMAVHIEKRNRTAET